MRNIKVTRRRWLLKKQNKNEFKTTTKWISDKKAQKGQLFITLPVSNCEVERSFSLMARVKNELRSKMCQVRLNSLSLMAIDDVVEAMVNLNQLFLF